MRKDYHEIIETSVDAMKKALFQVLKDKLPIDTSHIIDIAANFSVDILIREYEGSNLNHDELLELTDHFSAHIKAGLVNYINNEDSK